MTRRSVPQTRHFLVQHRARTAEQRNNVTWNPDHVGGEHLEGLDLLDLCCQAILHDVPPAVVFRILGVRVSRR